MLGKLLLHAPDIGAAVLRIGLQNGDPAADLLRLRLHLADCLAEPVGLQIAVMQVEGQRFGGHIEVIECFMLALQNENRRIIVLLRLARSSAEALQILQKQRDLHALELLTQRQIFLCFFRLLLQGADLQFQL